MQWLGALRSRCREGKRVGLRWIQEGLNGGFSAEAPKLHSGAFSGRLGLDSRGLGRCPSTVGRVSAELGTHLGIHFSVAILTQLTAKCLYNPALPIVALQQLGWQHADRQSLRRTAFSVNKCNLPFMKTHALIQCTSSRPFVELGTKPNFF